MRNLTLSILIWAAIPSLANATDFDIPRQGLSTSLQQLARQSGTQIIFLSRLVEGHDAAPVRGKVSIETALAVLLDGTALSYYRLNDKTIQIETGPVMAALPAATTSETQLDEVDVFGRDGRLSKMRGRLSELEDRFNEKYNKLNTDHQFDVNCSLTLKYNSRIGTRTCQAAFVESAYRAYYFCDRESSVVPQLEPADNQGLSSRFSTVELTACKAEQMTSAMATIMQKLPTYQKNMIEVVRKNPELLALLEERNEVARRLEAVRKRKFEEKFALWD
jgi:hypothetical protein